MLNNSAHSNPSDARPYMKWGKAAIAGWQPLPDVLLKYQYKLQINPTEMMVLLNILSFWWFVDELPFPRATTIAKRMDVTPRTVQRALNQLFKKELLLKKTELTVKGKEREVFDVSPLVGLLSRLAESDPDFQHKQNKRSGNEQEIPF